MDHKLRIFSQRIESTLKVRARLEKLTCKTDFLTQTDIQLTKIIAFAQNGTFLMYQGSKSTKNPA
jgi:hypothetical protein